jgi:hypothetical protein
MKKLILGALFLMIFAASNAYGQGANLAIATANGKARVVNPISLAVAGTSELNFGDVVPSTVTAGTVSLTPASVRAAAGGVTLGSSTSVGVPTFNVGGQANATYAITLPAGPSILTSGVNTMTVDTFTGSKATGTLSAGGADSFTVGGTLNVAQSQTAGSYAGTFSVTVAYN